jgi:hypothetical protein
MMNISDEFARAQIRDPISNNARATRKTFYGDISVCWIARRDWTYLRAVVLIDFPVEWL